MRFFVGLHQPFDCRHFDSCFVSVNRLRRRKSDFEVHEWIMDSGAFTELSMHGRYRTSVEDYAEQITRWRRCGRMLAAVSQDFMCEPFILTKTGLTVPDHQELTCDRYRQLRSLVSAYVMPVLQGFKPKEYLDHLERYGSDLKTSQWVGVGSVCKRNSSVEEVENILRGIKTARPDLRLHGFGLKITALESARVRQALHSADSMAWSYRARREGRNANDWQEAKAFERRIISQQVYPFPRQMNLSLA